MNILEMLLVDITVCLSGGAVDLFVQQRPHLEAFDIAGHLWLKFLNKTASKKESLQSSEECKDCVFNVGV